jgi:hypothetical protein
MSFKRGEVYKCTNSTCGAEVIVTKETPPGVHAEQPPRCCCGEEMRKR